MFVDSIVRIMDTRSFPGGVERDFRWGNGMYFSKSGEFSCFNGWNLELGG